MEIQSIFRWDLDPGGGAGGGGPDSLLLFKRS